MGYSVVPTVLTGDTWSAADMNTYVRDNFKAAIPDTFTAAGQLVYGTGANSAELLNIGSPHQYLGRNATTAKPEWTTRSARYCLVNSSIQNIPAYSSSKLSFTEVYDALFMYNPYDTDELLIPTDGVYLVSGYSYHQYGGGDFVYYGAIGPDDMRIFGMGPTAFLGGTIYPFSFVRQYTAGDDLYVKLYNPTNAPSPTYSCYLSILQLWIST